MKKCKICGCDFTSKTKVICNSCFYEKYIKNNQKSIEYNREYQRERYRKKKGYVTRPYTHSEEFLKKETNVDQLVKWDEWICKTIDNKCKVDIFDLNYIIDVYNAYKNVHKDYPKNIDVYKPITQLRMMWEFIVSSFKKRHPEIEIDFL